MREEESPKNDDDDDYRGLTKFNETNLAEEEDKVHRDGFRAFVATTTREGDGGSSNKPKEQDSNTLRKALLQHQSVISALRLNSEAQHEAMDSFLVELESTHDLLEIKTEEAAALKSEVSLLHSLVRKQNDVMQRIVTSGFDPTKGGKKEEGFVADTLQALLTSEEMLLWKLISQGDVTEPIVASPNDDGSSSSSLEVKDRIVSGLHLLRDNGSCSDSDERSCVFEDFDVDQDDGDDGTSLQDSIELTKSRSSRQQSLSNSSLTLTLNESYSRDLYIHHKEQTADTSSSSSPIDKRLSFRYNNNNDDDGDGDNAPAHTRTNQDNNSNHNAAMAADALLVRPKVLPPADDMMLMLEEEGCLSSSSSFGTETSDSKKESKGLVLTRQEKERGDKAQVNQANATLATTMEKKKKKKKKKEEGTDDQAWRGSYALMQKENNRQRGSKM